MKTELEKYAQRTGTITSLIGLVVGFIMVGLIFEGYDILLENGLLPYLLISATVMVYTARWISLKNAQIETQNSLVHLIAGAGSAVLSLFIASTIGTLLYVPIHLNDMRHDLWLYNLGPFWICLFGGFPAAIIGGIWGVVLSHVKEENIKSTTS